LVKLLDAHPDIKAGCLEGYSYNSTSKKFLLGEVGAVVKLTVSDKNIPLYEVAPLALKKFVTGRGSGSADKAVMRSSIYARWGVDIDQDDQADAYALAQVARSLILQNSNNRAELEVLKKLSSPLLKKPKRRGRLSALVNAL
jgi:Holliday junction resolvasome RuvABC endonuclease subunit